MKNGLVSIALCTYNGERFLKEQLDSLIDQTYHDLEIIIVDDCSTDDTLAIIKEYAERDSRIKWYQNEINLGFNQNFAHALKICSGKYIAVCDQDDIWEHNKIERLTDTIGDHWLVCSNSIRMDENGIPTGKNLLNDFTYETRDYRSVLLNNFVTGHTCLINRDFLDIALPFPDGVIYDWWMGFVALYHHQLIYLDETLTRYRIHDNSALQQIIKSDSDTKNTYLKIHFDFVSNMLNRVSEYSRLQPADADFVNELRHNYSSKNNDADSEPLINMILKHFSSLFPDKYIFPNIRLPKEGEDRLPFVADYSAKLIK